MLLDNYSSLRSAAGWIFESFAHIALSDPNRTPLRTYIGTKSGPAIPSPGRVISRSDALGKIQSPFDFYWHPREPNFPGVDALIRKGNKVWVLQYAISTMCGSAFKDKVSR